ncbi:hypothetical protein [Roseivirga misakiensis]|uniref:Sialidase domain-containing protein n=1 Tax=Roseivirga misakiensis TaxID=1563681 RepID=A0A1E5T4G8_9BACT|nr:hypothetical protein [Roseivirga misakiensis]OEK06270.1 hypothetical protein BFP71_00920 [Roseivirga misakiensis]
MNRVFYFLCLLAFCACQSNNELKIEVLSLDSPASTNSLTPRLFTNDEGKVYLSWLERKSESIQFKFTTLNGTKWDAPKLISEGNNWFVNWADFPSLIENRGTLSAHWLKKRAEGTYDYDVHVTQSRDRGQVWSSSFIAHKDSIAAEHGFVSMLPLDENQNFITWLDGRNTKSDTQMSHNGHHSGGAMTIRAGIFDDEGEMINEWELDGRTCDCCQTTAAITSNGPIVAYRDRSHEEIRDIYITRHLNGKWTTPKAIYNDNWEIKGCPVNGPSIVASQDLVAIAWFTATPGFSQVKMAISKDGGENFNTPVIISQGNTNGRVGTVLLENGNIAVSWMETIDKEANILVGIFDREGNEINRKIIAQTAASRASGFPVMTRNGNNLIMAWTESEESSIVKSAIISLD